MVAKIIGDWIVDQVVIWIQGGGKPRVLSPTGKNSQEMPLTPESEKRLVETGAAFSVRPFKLQVQIALLPVKRFQQRLECTLDGIVKNINNFFLEISVMAIGSLIGNLWYPQNNCYGTLIMVHDEAVARALAAENAAEEEADRRSRIYGSKKMQTCG